MNHVVAQGAPNSLIRYFQDNPADGVELLRAMVGFVAEATFRAPAILGTEAMEKLLRASEKFPKDGYCDASRSC